MNTDDEIYKYQPLWGNWYIELPIGTGSFGSVYRISREDMGRKYTAAVKFITVPNDEQRKEAEASLGDDEDTLSEYFGDIVRNIVGEIDMLYALSGNSNIISYQDHEVRKRQQGIGWDILIRMEYVTSLRKYLKEHSMTVEEVIRLGIDICTAMETCSKKGIIHRDIKDDNIFVSDDGVYKLGDFGIARELSKSGRAASMRGTPLYMAPEIYRGEKYDAAVDIYSLGIVLYKLLNYGRMPLMPPYPDKVSYQDSEDALEKRMSGVALPPPSLASGMLASVVLKACAYNAEERYSSPTEMKRALIKAFSMLSEVVRAQVVLSAPENSISRVKQQAKTGEPTIQLKKDCCFESTGSIFGDQQGSSHQDDRPRRTSATIGIFPSEEEQTEKKEHFHWQLEEDKKKRKKRKRLATFIALFCVVVGCFFLMLRFADAELIYFPTDGASASNASASNASASDDIEPYSSQSDYDNGAAIKENNESNITFITELDLCDQGLTDISFLKEEQYEHLEHLRLSCNNISDISALAGLKNLKWLEIDGNSNLSDISVLAELTNLEDLRTYHNNISDISALSSLSKLKFLCITDDIGDISALSGLTELRWLYLSECNINDISALKGLNNLYELYIDNNNIGDISDLRGLINLTSLNLNDNKIHNIDALSGLTNLKYLTLSNNFISDISPIKNLTDLTWLFLENNPIADYSPVKGYYDQLEQKDFIIN